MQEDTYRVYHTDLLRAICMSLGVKKVKRYYDILHPQPVDNRDALTIAVERLEHMGIKVVD